MFREEDPVRQVDNLTACYVYRVSRTFVDAAGATWDEGVLWIFRDALYEPKHKRVTLRVENDGGKASIVIPIGYGDGPRFGTLRHWFERTGDYREPGEPIVLPPPPPKVRVYDWVAYDQEVAGLIEAAAAGDFDGAAGKLASLRARPDPRGYRAGALAHDLRSAAAKAGKRAAAWLLSNAK